MPTNAQALSLIRSIGETPGFAMESSGDDFKVWRLPFRDLPTQSVKISPRARETSLQNAYTRVKRDLGWSWELRKKIDTIQRDHRLEGTDPGDDIDRLLVEAFAAEIPAQGNFDSAERPVTKRHGKGGTAAGSAKPRKIAAQPGTGATEAPIQLIPEAPEIRAELISPERALDLLARLAPYQRALRREKVRDYAAAMVRDEWTLNPAGPICIDTNNATLNGQHYLEAVIECEMPQPFYVAYGVDPDAYKHMNRGAKRTTSDMLYGAGEVNTANLAGVAKIAYLYFNVAQDQWRNAPEVTEPQVFATLEEHPGLRESVRLGRIGGGMKVSPTGGMFAHYLISRSLGGDTRLPTAWYRAIASVDLPRGNPGHTLALYFLKKADAAKRRTELAGRTKRELDIYLLLRGWNNTCAGKEMRSVAWKLDFQIPEPDLPGPRATLPEIE